MSWLELDDGILDHPKFIRAVKLGGSEAVHLWLGIRAYCGKLLTDGFVPEDMIDEVRGPKDPKRRALALEALRAAGLLDLAEGGFQMHDYLDWSKSRDKVLAARKQARDRQAKSRGCHGVTDSVTNEVTNTSSHGAAGSGVGVVSGSQVSDPTGNRAREPDNDGDTICPADLVQRLEKAGVYTEIASSLRVSVEDLRAEAEEYAAYWTIGAGMGKKRRQWAGRLRQRLVEKARSGDLAKAKNGATADDTGGYGNQSEWTI
jgi:hypothetical protein